MANKRNGLLKLLALVLPERWFIGLLRWMMRNRMICVECGLCGQEIYAESFEAMYEKMQWHAKVCEVQEAEGE